MSYRFELWAHFLFLDRTSVVAVHWRTGDRSRDLRVHFQPSVLWGSTTVPGLLLADVSDGVGGLKPVSSVLIIAHFWEIVQILFYRSSVKNAEF